MANNVDEIQTPLNSYNLKDKYQYEFYFSLLQHTLDQLIKNTDVLDDSDYLTRQETTILRKYTERLLYSINALSLRFGYSLEDKMEIDVTESGFPNGSAIRFISNDISFAKIEKMQFDSIEQIREKFIKKLIQEKTRITAEELEIAAISIFHNTIEYNKLFKKFHSGKIRYSQKDYADYVVSWSYYDSTYNRPFVCIMYFDIDGEYEPKDIYDDLIAVVKKNSGTLSSLDSVAYHIDSSLEYIIPKKLKKIDLGPFYNIFTKDDEALSLLLRKGVLEKIIPMNSFALRIIIENVETKGIVEIKNSWLSKKLNIQNWSKVSKNDYLFAPHVFIRYINDEDKKLLNQLSYTPLVVEEAKM